MSASDRGGAGLVRAGEGQHASFEWGEITWIASAGAGNAEQMTFGRVVIRAGRSNPTHWHPDCEEVLHLLAGRLEHEAGDETYLMAPGDTLVIRPGARHRARSVGSEDAVMLVAYPTPDRRMQTDQAPGTRH